jgi:formylglycine-generating enzyme required for sulfatase activity
MQPPEPCPLPEFAEINVTTIPQGAMIYLENVQAGSSPVLIKSIKSGRHQIKLSKEGYQEQVMHLELAGGEEKGVTVSLVPIVIEVPPEEIKSDDGQPKEDQRKNEKGYKVAWILAAILFLVVVIARYMVGEFATGVQTPSLPGKKARSNTVGMKKASKPFSGPEIQGNAPSSGGIVVPSSPPEKRPLVPFDTPNKDLFIDPLLGVEFVLVKGGCFHMGDPYGEGLVNELPLHEVCLDDYYIGRYEITQGQWKAVMGHNPARFKKGDDYPVEQVSWRDIQDFLGKLNQRNHINYRLPTEAEWEFAARSRGRNERWAGTDIEQDLDGYAWFNANSGKSTHPVGRKKPNELGIYDLSGNVEEWVLDWYAQEYYGASSPRNPTGPESGISKVLRGGSWSYKPRYNRTSRRGDGSLSARVYNAGFRLALPAQQ